MEIKKIAELKGHDAGIYTMCYDEKNKRLYSGGGDKILASWNMQTFEPHPFAIKSLHTIYSSALLEDQHLLCLGQSKGGIHIIDLHSKQEIKYILAESQAIFDLLFIPEHQYLVSASASGEICIWNTIDFSLKYKYKISDQKIRKIIYKNNILWIPCQDGKIYRLNLINKTFLLPLENASTGFNTGLYISDPPYFIAGGKDAHFYLFKDQENSTTPAVAIPAHNYAVYGLQKSPCNRYIASASRDKTIKIWDIQTLELLQRIDFKIHKAHTHSVNTILWTSDFLVSAGDDRKIMVWEVS